MGKITNPPSHLNYTEDPEQANEYLRLVLPMLVRLMLPPNPVNFTLCYEYVSGHNQPLHDVMDRVLHEQKGLSKEAAIELYRRYIWDDDKRVIEKQRTEFRRLMSETLTGVDQSADQASQASETLGSCSDRLQSSGDLNEIREVVAEVVTETRNMAQNGSILKEMLNETKREVENLREELEHSRQQATTDALTGLLNRRAFDEVIHQATEDANMDQEPLSLLMVDIDHFKQVNDNHGHLVGDKVIRYIAGQLRKNVKGKDTVARIGGEEFAVMLPNTNLDHARIVAESIRKTVAHSQLKRMDNQSPIGSVTISIGTTNYRPGEGIDQFIQRADEALYISKNAGRNRVSIA